MKKKAETVARPDRKAHEISVAIETKFADNSPKARRMRALWAMANGGIAAVFVYTSTHDSHLAFTALCIVALLTKE